MLYCSIYPFYYQRLKNLVITSMKKTIFIAIFLGLLVSGGFFYRWWQTTKVTDLRFTTVPEIQLVDNLTVEFANDANLSDFFASFTGQTFTEIPIDTGAIGEQVVTFAYRDQKNRLRHASFVLTVIDTVAPTALYSKYTMMVGENDDLIAQIPCGDNKDHIPCANWQVIMIPMWPTPTNFPLSPAIVVTTLIINRSRFKLSKNMKKVPTRR